MSGKSDKTCSPVRNTGGQVDGERATPTLSQTSHAIVACMVFLQVL